MRYYENIRRRAGLVAASLLTVTVVAGWPAGAAATPTHGSCQDVTVNLSGSLSGQRIKGTYCTPASWAAGQHAADLLVHGGTYNRSYWDVPVQNPQYSYVDRTLQAGRATLAIDKFGAGASSKLVSSQVTVQAGADALHQTVQWLRNVQGLPQVNMVAHSIGSITAAREAGTYRDVSRLVLTGFTHGVSPGASNTLTALYPAAADPKFAAAGLDPGYLTTRPGTRQAAFYNATADPAVVAFDEANKDIFSSTEQVGSVADIQTPAAANVSNGITAPTLIVVGRDDAIFCGTGASDCSSDAAVKAGEAPYYTHAARLQASVIANTGHDVALHPTAGASFVLINDWLKQ